MINKRDIYDFVKKAGLEAYPNEACGLIIRVGKASIPVQCKNESLDPRHNFFINPDESRKVEEKGEIIGCWHTHCEESAWPSKADRAACNASDLPWFIASFYKRGDKVEMTDLQCVTPNEENPSDTPLIGRPYAFGIFDCFSFVHDYMYQIMNIEIGQLERTEQCFDIPGFTRDAAIQCGFVQVYDAPRRGDLFLIQTEVGEPDHAAIYDGNDRIMHHMRNRLSRSDIYGGSYWQLHTISHWRHKVLC